jgi:predicted nucleotide-binding protein
MPSLNLSAAGVGVTYFHVRITVKGEPHDETKLDLDEDGLERGYLAPYRDGTPITVNGRSIPMEKVARIRISASEDSGDVLIRFVNEERSNSRIGIVGGPSIAWRAAAEAADVTDQYITGPPGQPSGKTQLTGPGDGRSVFVVAGRDNTAVGAVLAFIRTLGLRVVEWEQAVARTGLPNPYVGDVVLAGMKMADATLVLLTPDDIVQLREDLLLDDDGPQERAYAAQARPNVFYEAGIADGLGRERTVIVEVGRVKPFTDVAGRHVLRLDGSPGRRNALVERLRSAGLEPETSGTDWLTAGDIAGAINEAKEVLDSFDTRKRVGE